jgi:hypothetical protein
MENSAAGDTCIARCCALIPMLLLSVANAQGENEKASLGARSQRGFFLPVSSMAGSNN